jgi:hypothetical protein
LGKLRKEKIESIKKTFERTKSLKKTAEIEEVTARTVSKHVSLKETDPTVGHTAGSESESTQHSAHESESLRARPDIRFKVYKAFESGSTNVTVCLKFKLSPELVTRYREEHSIMKKADFDVELEKRNILRTEVEAAIQRRNKELSDLESRIEKENARLIELQDRLSKSSDGYLEDFLQKMENVPENHLYEYAYPIVTSDFYARALGQLNVKMVLGAITRYPNLDKLFHELENRALQNLSSANDMLIADGVDVQILVDDVKKNAARSTRIWKQRWQAKNFYEQSERQSGQAE